MFYTIYKITNLVNNKIYIGKHQTKDLNDNYMGSGKQLKRAIEKYGIENFEKEILFIFEAEKEMNAKEAELVTEEFVLEDTNYNLCPGGQGGWGYVNSTGLRTKGHNKEMYNKISHTLKNKPKEVHNHPNKIKAVKKLHEQGKVRYDNTKGKTHTEETKHKISLSKKGKNKGEGNSQYGTIWITNGFQNRKINSSDKIPLGWQKGRIYPPDLKKPELCSKCKINIEDKFWWDKFLNSNMSVSSFVKEIYPYNRATFYNMKNRIRIIGM